MTAIVLPLHASRNYYATDKNPEVTARAVLQVLARSTVPGQAMGKRSVQVRVFGTDRAGTDSINIAVGRLRSTKPEPSITYRHETRKERETGVRQYGYLTLTAFGRAQVGLLDVPDGAA